jgi:hypothetical protein
VVVTWQDVTVHNDASGRRGQGPATSRRGFLRGVLGVAGVSVVGVGAAGALAGCDVFGGGGDSGANTPDAPSPLLGFLASTAALADQYDAAILAAPTLTAQLTPVRDAHRAHVKALAAAINQPTPRPSSTAATSIGDPATVKATLVTAEKAARDEAVAACLAAAPRTAPLIGSIAAARATHLEVLT